MKSTGLAALAAIIALLAPAAAHAAFPGANGRIAFSHVGSDPNEQRSRVRSILPSGEDRRWVSPEDAHESGAEWSPDGERMLVSSVTASTHVLLSDIFVMNADGTGRRNLTQHPADDLGGSWSPDGRRIVFSSNRGGDPLTYHLYVMDADGSNVRQLTTAGRQNGDPKFSPDGRKIAFSRAPSYHFFNLFDRDIHVIDADGSNDRRITPTDHHGESHPDWSPDGRRIVFMRTDPHVDLWTADADGGDERRLTDDGGASHELAPVFSPDGTSVAYAGISWPDGFPASALVTMRTDGTQRRELFREQDERVAEPSWAPVPKPTDSCDIAGAGGWALRASASEDDGLIVQDVRYGPRQFARRMSLPWFELRIDGDTVKGELTKAEGDGAPGRIRSSLHDFRCESDAHDVEVSADYLLYGLPGRYQSMVTQTYRFSRRHLGDECEPSAALPCARFWPTVRFELAPGADRVEQFRSIQRFELWPDGTPGNTANLFHDAAKPKALAVHRSPVDAIDDPVMKKEDAGRAIVDGQKDYWDNFHQSSRDSVPRPKADGPIGGLGALLGTSFAAGTPGCADCVHLHWHWGQSVNGLTPGFTDDLPLLLAGSQQSANWFVTRKEPLGEAGISELDPVDTGLIPLVDRANATGQPGSLLERDANGRLESRPVFWFDAASRGVRDGTGGRSDEIFPVLTHDVSHGGESSGFFAPAERLFTLPSLSSEDEGNWVEIDPRWNEVARAADGHWTLPVDLALDGACRPYDLSDIACVPGRDGGILFGPFYLMARPTGATWLNPDALYRRTPSGAAFRTVEDANGQPLDRLGYTVRRDARGRKRPVPDRVTVTLQFDERPVPGNLDLALTRAPMGGGYPVWTGFPGEGG